MPLCRPILVAFVAAVVLVCGGPAAHALTMTVIAQSPDSQDLTFGTEGEGSPLTFLLPEASLPDGATLTGAELVLVAADGKSPGTDVVISLGEARYSSQLDQGQPPPGARLRAPVGLPGEPSERISLRVTGMRTWHSALAMTSAHRPRLVLRYEVPGAVPFQSPGTPFALGTGRVFPNSDPTSVRVRPVVDPGQAWSYAPVLQDGLVYVLVGNEANAKLQARRPLDGQVLWSVDLGEAGQHLVMGRTAERLYVLGADLLHAFRLNLDDREQLPTRIGPWTVPNLLLDATKPPAVGPDGSLFFVTGQEAIGLNPALQELWRVPVVEVSAPTLSPSGAYVYLASKANGLIAIDAATGETTVPEETTTPKEETRSAAPPLLPPVVIVHPDRPEKVYLGLTANGQPGLALFHLAASSDATASLTHVRTQPGRWSNILPDPRPAEVGKTILALGHWNGQTESRLHAFDWIELEHLGSSERLTFGQSTDVSLTLDASGRFFAWPAEGQNLAIGMAPTTNSPSPLELALSPNGPPESRLMIGDGGTLFLRDMNANTRDLRLVVPRVGLETDLCTGGPVEVFGRAAPGTRVSLGGPVILAAGTSLGPNVTIGLGGCPPTP